MGVQKKLIFLCIGVLCVAAASATALCALFGAGAKDPTHYRDVQVLSPLFAFPGTDTDKLDTAVAAFARSANAALPHFPQNAAAREYIYPLTFLAKIPATEKARRALIAEPNLQNAESYHKALVDLIETHQSALAHALDLLAQDPDTATYAFFSGSTDIAHIRTVLTSAQKADTESLAKESRRFACLQGDAISCTLLHTLSLTFGDNLAPPAGSEETARTYAQLLENRYPGISKAPLYTLTHSQCFAKDAAHFAMVAHTSRLSGYPFEELVYVDDLYFEDTRTSTHPFYALLREGGASFTFQPFNAYLCLDMGHDRGTLLSMQVMRENLSSANNPKSDDQFFSTAATDYLKDREVRESLYLRVGHAAAAHVRISSPEETGAHPMFAELATMVRARSGNFDSVVSYFDDMQIGSYIPYQLSPISPSAFFLARSGLSELYGLNNATIFPAQTSLASNVQIPDDTHAAPYVSYRNAIGGEPALRDIPAVLETDWAAQTRVFAPFIQKIIALREHAPTAQ